MSTITLQHQTESGRNLKASFLPEKGMTLSNYTLDEIEVIDQSTRPLFEQRFAGLGPLIGPHFHRRPKHLIPTHLDEKLFPHIRYVKNDPLPDPFTHGIGRYAPWLVDFDSNSFQAKLTSEMIWNEIPLFELEGQNFEMYFNGKLTEEGLHLELSVVSDLDSIVGIHYYYHLPNGKGTVHSRVQNSYIKNNVKGPLPEEWNYDSHHRLTYPLNQDTDFTFFPFPDSLNGNITLETDTHRLHTSYHSDSAENSWQLWHPKGASFVCIEPVSSQNPRRPNLSVSSIQINLQIEMI